MTSEASVSIISMPLKQMLHHMLRASWQHPPACHQGKMLHHSAADVGVLILDMTSEQMLQYSIACLAALQALFVFGREIIIAP